MLISVKKQNLNYDENEKKQNMWKLYSKTLNAKKIAWNWWFF